MIVVTAGWEEVGRERRVDLRYVRSRHVGFDYLRLS